MFPKIISINSPDFLKGIFGNHITIYSYGLCIGIGVLLCFYILYNKTHKIGITKDKLSELFMYCIAAAFIGGKVVFWLESPELYINNPSLLFKNLGNGFVFYGSLIFVIPTIYYWLKKNKVHVLLFFDALSLGGPILHAFGRLGCFLAGCCYGKVCQSPIGIVFTHPQSAARPIGQMIYPTQLMDMALNLFIFLGLVCFQKYKKFEGQMFLIYIVCYAIGRSVIEQYRGDTERGFVFNGVLSYSQLIAIILIIIVAIVWKYLSKKSKTA